MDLFERRIFKNIEGGSVENSKESHKVKSGQRSGDSDSSIERLKKKIEGLEKKKSIRMIKRGRRGTTDTTQNLARRRFIKRISLIIIFFCRPNQMYQKE